MPTPLQLRRHALHCAIPFVGFGFVDNLIMITAGDMIDNTLGVHFALPTLVAAACGQVLSDTGGVLFGSTIEAVASRLGLPASHLTERQFLMRHVQVTGTLASALGVIAGCLLGMSVMLFMDLGKAERQKRQQELAKMLDSMLESLRDVIQVQECTLWLFDEEEQHLVARGTRTGHIAAREALRVFHHLDTDRDGLLQAREISCGLQQLGYEASIQPHVDRAVRQHGLQHPGFVNPDEFGAVLRSVAPHAQLRVKITRGSLHELALRSSEPVIINQPQDDPRFDSSGDRLSIHRTRSVLLCPIVIATPDGAKSPRVLGLLEMKNRFEHDSHEIIGFSQQDNLLALLLARNIGYFHSYFES